MGSVEASKRGQRRTIIIRQYYYNQQLKKFIVGFANIFTGLKVRTGKDGCGDISEIEVPIIYGSRDRVVSAIGASNTQNKQYTLPMLACYQTGLEMDPSRMKGVNQVDRRSYLEQGGVYPDDVKSIKRVMPVPYNMQMELAIHASNTDQLYQILEQILILFDYDLQLQFNDAPFDWSRVTSLFLQGINNEENYPLGVDRRMLIWTLQFNMPVWLSPPIEIRNEIIATINLRYGDLADFVLDEIDENGNLAPFTEPWTSTELAVPANADAVNPPSNATPNVEHFDPSLEPCNINPLAKP